jgi:hypothetical protein
LETHRTPEIVAGVARGEGRPVGNLVDDQPTLSEVDRLLGPPAPVDNSEIDRSDHVDRRIASIRNSCSIEIWVERLTGRNWPVAGIDAIRISGR